MPPFLLPIFSLPLFFLVMNEAWLATRQRRRLTLHDKKTTFLVLLLRQTRVFCHQVHLYLLFSTWNSTLLSEHWLLSNTRVWFSCVFFFFPSHSILLAISGTAHSMAYFYHLDCLCLVTSSAFLNDWSEEHLKTPFISLIAKIKKNYQMKNFLTRMILHDSK